MGSGASGGPDTVLELDDEPLHGLAHMRRWRSRWEEEEKEKGSTTVESLTSSTEMKRTRSKGSSETSEVAAVNWEEKTSLMHDCAAASIN